MNKQRFLLVLIVVLSVILRFYKLGENPPSLDWDEASLGYNAYSILKTGSDEYGNKLPLSFRSFDDYKPPVYVYLTILSVAFFGLTEFAVRLPSAVFGVIAVVMTYFLVKTLFKKWEERNGKWNHTSHIALLTSLFLAISPWHLQFSRAAFEGNIGLTFFIIGVCLFLFGLKKGRYLIFSSLSFLLSLYSYHSFRVLVPVFLIAAFGLFYRQLLNNKKSAILAGVLFFVLSLPLAFDLFLSNESLSRFSMVTIFSGHDLLKPSIKRMEYDKNQRDFIGAFFHNRRIVYLRTIIKNYLDHWDSGFLFIHGDGGRQHHAVEMGMLYLIELPFIILGIGNLLSGWSNKRVQLLGIWFLASPLASSVSTGTPHPVRAIGMVLPLHIFAAVGLIRFIKLVRKLRFGIGKEYFIYILTFLLFVFNFIYYLHQYYVHTPIEYSDAWQYGYKQAFKKIATLEKRYDKIIFTYKYDQPYIYYLFYNKIDPLWYQRNWNYTGTGKTDRFRRIIGKYEFRNINLSKDRKIKNALLIGTPEEIPENAPGIINQIKFLDNSVAFRIVET